MRFPFALLLLSLQLQVVAAAGPEVVEVPKPVSPEWKRLPIAAGTLVVLGAQPASEWEVVEGKGLDLRTFEGGRFAALVATKGEYRVVIVGPDKAKTRLILDAGGDGPAPDPAKPDALKTKLRAAYDADKDAAKQSHAKDLAAVYKLVAKSASDPTFTTAGEFIAFARKSAAEMVDAGQKTRALSGVRDVVAVELGAIFAADGPLTDAQRAAAADLFTRLAAILDGF